MSKNRLFRSYVPQHIYQIAEDSGVIFYKTEDYLVFYTLFCTLARKMHIQVLCICLMINHIHALVTCSNGTQLSTFVQAYSSRFSKEYNQWRQRKGSLFARPYGNASKGDNKKVMSCIAYIGNNPVLKRLCTKAEEYIWGFIPFAVSTHPFSQPLVIRKSSVILTKAVKLVKSFIKEDLPLHYATLDLLFNKLSVIEARQLTDYIISAYNCIDYKETIRYYGTYEKMCLALDANSGAEYDIKEPWAPHSDCIYAKMIAR